MTIQTSNLALYIVPRYSRDAVTRVSFPRVSIPRVVCEQNAIRSLLTSPNGKIQILPKPRDLNGDFNRSRILISETIIITITTPHAPRRCCIIVNNEACNVATMSKRNLNLPRERKSSSSKNRGGGGGLSTFVNYVPRE